MTKPLGAGTVNTALNMSREERQLWGRAAFCSDASLNQFLQECALAKLKEIQPALANEIAKVRQARGMVIRLAKEAGKIGVTIVLIGLMIIEGSDLRRSSRNVRVRKGKDDALEVVG
jgi:hypothetical protein